MHPALFVTRRRRGGSGRQGLESERCGHGFGDAIRETVGLSLVAYNSRININLHVYVGTAYKVHISLVV